MRLAQLRKSWIAMSKTEKLELIDSTNERRIEAFEVKVKKRSGKKKSTTKKRRSRTTPKSPQGLLKLMADMSPEERENFKLMLNMDK